MRAVAIICLSFATASLALLQLPGLAALDKRQDQDIAPGTPLYDCHAHCGGVIVDARTTGYCINSTYTTDLADCLECALSEDIWQYYGSYVEAAASACGNSSTPSPSSAVASSESTATAANVTSSATSAPSSAIATSATSSSAASSITATTAGLTSAAAPVATTTTTSAAASTFTGAAARVEYEKVILLAGAGVVLQNLVG